MKAKAEKTSTRVALANDMEGKIGIGRDHWLPSLELVESPVAKANEEALASWVCARALVGHEKTRQYGA